MLGPTTTPSGGCLLGLLLVFDLVNDLLRDAKILDLTSISLALGE
jgi:hypothetical protein